MWQFEDYSALHRPDCFGPDAPSVRLNDGIADTEANPQAGGFVVKYNGPQNLDSVISYTWEIKGGGPSGTNAKEVSAFI